jgi:hypothetical protein
MPNRNAKTKLSKKQINALMKDKSFKHSQNDDMNGEYEIDLDDLTLKEYNQIHRMKNGKPFVVKKGGSIFGKIKRGFEKAGNKLKNTFSEKNLKTAAKVAIPGIVGGVTSLGVGSLASAASLNPVAGAALGGLSGAVANKATSVALNKALGDGLKECGHKRKCNCEKMGNGIADVIMSLASDPMVKQALVSAGLAAGSYLTKKGIELIKNKIGRKKFDRIQQISNETGLTGVVMQNENIKKASDMYNQGLAEQQKFTDFQNQINNPPVVRTNTPVVRSRERYRMDYGDGIVGYDGKGISGYKGKGISGYKKGGSVVIKQLEQDAQNKGTLPKLKDENQLRVAMSHVVKKGGSVKDIKLLENMAKVRGTITNFKSDAQI